jgi:SAM-dependent methyltransferase
MPLDDLFVRWLDALDTRHFADLRVQEVTRALRALSSVYVERRDALAKGAALDSTGKRVAFALFYGPLHYLVTGEIVKALGASEVPPGGVIDLGCGTGAAGAAWAMASGGRCRVLGLDRHPWAVAEACWTYRAFGLEGFAREDEAGRARLPDRPAAIVAGFAVNELRDVGRDALLHRLLAVARRGSRVLIVEPIAKPTGGWWDRWADAFRAGGGREDTWRFEANLPERLRLLDRAAGLDHRVLTARTLYIQ